MRNRVGRALLGRLRRAIRDGDRFRALLVLPLHPNGNFLDSEEVHAVMQQQFHSVCRGPASLLGRLRDEFPNADLERCYALCEGCEPGHAKNVSTCVPCPAGTHNTDGLGDCAPCAPGSIAETSGSAECALCNVDGGQTSSAARTACECRAGSYDPGAGANCVDCPGGADCPQGSTLATITAKEGYYRFHTGAERFYECPTGDDACVGGTAGDAICREDAYGPLCKLCRPGTFRFTGIEGRAQCKSCTKETDFLWEEVIRSAAVVVVWAS